MNLNEMYVISLKNKEILNSYIFNKAGVNIILGVAKTDSNGVGKTAMVDGIRMILGEAMPIDFCGKEELAKRDIMLVLKVQIEDGYKYLARHIINPNEGYISDKISFDIRGWESYDIKEYRTKIQSYIYNNVSESNIPSLQEIREYIIRDEKLGFNEIGLPKRKAIKVSQCLNFLSLLPIDYEEQINKFKKEQATLENEIKLLKTISKDIVKLRNDKIKIESEISKLKNMLDTANINQKIDYDEVKYMEAKQELKKIEVLILKNDFKKKQFEQSINNLTEKHNKVKELIELDNYYSQLLNYFPNDLIKNYEEMEAFFSFMLENRGDYFKEQISRLIKEEESIKKEKQKVQEIIANCSKVFQNELILEDIYNINDDLNTEYMKLADIKVKIDKYDGINDLTKQFNEKGKQILEKTIEYEMEYNKYSKNISDIEKYFKDIVNETYNEDGLLEYKYENDAKRNASTGRIKITCQIADENSHGRLYMKINMFDLALFFNRIDKKSYCQFLIHDGSYCKPNPESKAKIIKYVDSHLKSIGRGQYFITLNKSEIEKDDLLDFREKDMIIAEFDRELENKNRFFGCKY